MRGIVRMSQCRIFVQKGQPGIFRQIQRLDEFQNEVDIHKQSDLDQQLLQFLPNNRHRSTVPITTFTPTKKRKVYPHCP